MKWFRLYSEARTDAKLRTLTSDQFRIWFNLLCFASEQDESRGSIIGYDVELLAVEVADGNTDLLTETLSRLEKLRIIGRDANADADDLHFLHFDRRQYDKPSDRPERVAERVRAHRERLAETCNAPVTPSNAPKRAYSERERDTDLETERDQTQTGPSSGKGFSTERERHPTPEGSREQRPAHGSLSPSNNLPSTPPTATASTRQPPPRPAPPDASEPPPNTDAQLYDALVTAIGQAPTTRAAKAEWGAWLRQLAEARASPTQIAERCLIYRRRYGPEIPLTPRALVRQWDQLTSESPGGVAHATAATTTLAAASAAVEDRRRAERERLAEEKRRAAQEILGDLNTWPGRAEQRGAAPARTQPAANGYGAGAARR